MPAAPSKSLWSSSLGGIGDAFGDANFRCYSVGAIVSWLSFFVQGVAVSWVAWSLTHSTRWLAIVALLDILPMSLLAPLGGVIADRYDRFRILQISYAFATLQAALLAGVAYAGALNIGWLASLGFLHGLVHAFSVPAAYGLLPRFVERKRLPSAIAVASAYAQLGLFVGPALGGWVIVNFGPATAFASNVLGYGVFFWSSALLRTPPGYAPPPASKQSFMTDLFEGLRAIADHRGIVGVIVLMLFGNTLSASVRQMAPAFADDVLHAGVAGLSTLLTSAGVGATLSAIWLAHGGLRRSSPSVILWAFLCYLVATASLMAAPTLALAAAAMAARGFCFEICRTGTLALLQTSVPDGIRGRLMSAQFLLQQGASAFGVAVVGALAQSWGLQAPIWVGTGLALLVWIAAYRERARIAASFAISGAGD